MEGGGKKIVSVREPSRYEKTIQIKACPPVRGVRPKQKDGQEVERFLWWQPSFLWQLLCWPVSWQRWAMQRDAWLVQGATYWKRELVQISHNCRCQFCKVRKQEGMDGYHATNSTWCPSLYLYSPSYSTSLISDTLLGTISQLLINEFFLIHNKML